MLLAAVLLAVGMVRDDWYKFEPEGGEVRVALPARPGSTMSRSVTSPAAGEILLTTARLQAPDGVYSVQITENAGRVDPKTLDEGVRRYAASQKATLGATRPITVGGNPGREFELVEGAKRSRVRFVASGGTLVVLAAAGLPGANVPAGAARFLDSLQFGGPDAPAPPSAADVAAAEAKSRADAARAKAEAELAEAKLQAEIAKAKAEAEIAKTRAEAEVARVKAEAKAKADEEARFADALDPTMTVEVEKKDDDAKGDAKAATKRPNGPVKVTLSRMPKDAKPYPRGEVEDLGKSLGGEREGFRDVGPEGSILVGVRVTYIERFGGPKVRSAQPIYRLGEKHYAGLTYGTAVGPATTVVARPGYAVGGLVTHTGLTVDGFGIVFMKVDGDRLDADDTYNSPWIGDRKGGSPGQVSTRGNVVVGLQGRARDELNAIGLLMHRKSDN